MGLKVLFMTISTLLEPEVPNLLPAICWVESKHKTTVINKNDGNSHSYGICQVKLATANWMKSYYRIPGKPLIAKDLMQPELNVLYAGLYLKYQTKVYKGNLICTISAYNAGRCVKGNQSTYVKKVLNKLRELDASSGIASVDPLKEVVMPPYKRGYVPEGTSLEPSLNLF